jgi:hypothetical protein
MKWTINMSHLAYKLAVRPLLPHACLKPLFLFIVHSPLCLCLPVACTWCVLMTMIVGTMIAHAGALMWHLVGGAWPFGGNHRQEKQAARLLCWPLWCAMHCHQLFLEWNVHLPLFSWCWNEVAGAKLCQLAVVNQGVRLAHSLSDCQRVWHTCRGLSFRCASWFNAFCGCLAFRTFCLVLDTRVMLL